MKSQQGFTLIELVMVIVILGILAATALPKFASLQGDARKASIESVAGAVKSAMAITHAKSMVDGKETAATSTMVLEGTTINMVYGYPANASIAAAAGITSTDYTISGGTISLRANCNVVYTQARNAATAPTVTVTTTGC